MRTNLKRKNFALDEKKVRRVRVILGKKTETEAIDAALDLVVFKKEILASLERSRARAVSKRFSSGQASHRPYLYNIDLIQSRAALPIVRELYENAAPGIYFSSIVIQELLAGRAEPRRDPKSKLFIAPSSAPAES